MTFLKADAHEETEEYAYYRSDTELAHFYTRLLCTLTEQKALAEARIDLHFRHGSSPLTAASALLFGPSRDPEMLAAMQRVHLIDWLIEWLPGHIAELNARGE